MHLSDMTGIELLNRASSISPSAMRIIVGGIEEKPVLLKMLAKGLIHSYVVRPWDEGGIRDVVNNAVDMRRDLLERHLRELINTPDRLPSPPKFHERLRALLRKETSSLQRIAAEIENDPILVAKILRVANSVYYGARTTISSIRDAVVFIGTEYIASLVLAIEAFHNVTKSADPQSARAIDQLWHQALRRATIAKMIGKKWPGFEDGDLAYVTSLLQDIGYVVRLAYDRDKYAEFQRVCRMGTMDIFEAEQRIFMIMHPEVGAALLSFWNLPKPIVTAIADHHGPSRGDALCQIVQIADILESSDGSIPHDADLNPEILQWARTLHLRLPRGISTPAESDSIMLPENMPL
jgi:HD-like signal output (HDOD) protein